jgi:predicted oxidoreductase
MAWSAVVHSDGWSEDNAKEIASGFIKKANTIEQLAEVIGLDPRVLNDEVARYNAACAKGVDADFSRNPDSLLPIVTGPFYAAPVTPSLVCTGGGARRDMDGRVFNHDDTFIPRLFEAGELGSMFSDLYQNGSYITEAMITGRNAARAALAETPTKISEKAV